MKHFSPPYCLATAQTLDQLAFHGNRSAGGGVLVLGAIADGGIPDDLAIAGVEGDQVRFVAGHENVIAVDRDAAHRRRARVGSVAILPNELAGLGVQGLQHLSGVVHIEHAVVDDGRGIVAQGVSILHGPTPHLPQVVHVLRGDLIQRAEGAGLVIAPDHQPIGRIRIAQHGIGHGDIVFHFALDGNSAGRLLFLFRLLASCLACAAAGPPPVCKYAAR